MRHRLGQQCSPELRVESNRFKWICESQREAVALLNACLLTQFAAWCSIWWYCIVVAVDVAAVAIAFLVVVIGVLLVSVVTGGGRSAGAAAGVKC